MAFDIYEAVTSRIIEQLEEGNIPWRKPWTGTRSGAYSRSTGRAYSLINQMLLVKPGEYLTFKQCQEAGGNVKKGAKAKMVVFWKMLPIEDEKSNGEKVKRNVPFLRYFNVFHIDECEGIEPKYKPEDLKPFDPIAEAEAMAADYLERTGCRLEHVRGNEASYSPSLDRVKMPLREQFDGAPEYYSTLFHELTHSTGHSSRLSRIDSVHFGDEAYSKEELVAEIGAASVLNFLGIETPASFRNSAAYIHNWIKVLKNDKRMIVSAASKAEKAFNMISATDA